MPSYWLPIDDPASAQYDAQVMAVLKDIKSLSSRVPAWPLDTGTSAANGMTSQKWLSYRALLWNVIRYYLKPGTTDWQAVLLPVTVPAAPFPYTMVFDAACNLIASLDLTIMSPANAFPEVATKAFKNSFF